MSKVWSNDNKMDVDNVWDDTELIKMYEASIQETIPKNKKKSSKSNGESEKVNNWKVGQKCMAPYSGGDTETVEYYAASIDRISEDNNEVTVTFLYYGDEATVAMSELWENEEAVAEALKMEEEQKKPAAKKSQPSSSSNATIPLPSFAPPVPPNIVGMVPADEREALSSMLMSWYMSGYHTGYYQAMSDQKKRSN